LMFQDFVWFVMSQSEIDVTIWRDYRKGKRKMYLILNFWLFWNFHNFFLNLSMIFNLLFVMSSNFFPIYILYENYFFVSIFEFENQTFIYDFLLFILFFLVQNLCIESNLLHVIILLFSLSFSKNLMIQ